MKTWVRVFDGGDPANNEGKVVGWVEWIPLLSDGNVMFDVFTDSTSHGVVSVGKLLAERGELIFLPHGSEDPPTQARLSSELFEV